MTKLDSDWKTADPVMPTIRRAAGDRGLGLLAALALLLYLAFLVLPLLLSLRSSFTNENPLRATSDFVGLRNYREMAGDSELRASLGVHADRWPSGSRSPPTRSASAFAMLLNRTGLSYRVMRTVAFLPQVLSRRHRRLRLADHPDPERPAQHGPAEAGPDRRAVPVAGQPAPARCCPSAWWSPGCSAASPPSSISRRCRASRPSSTTWRLARRRPRHPAVPAGHLADDRARHHDQRHHLADHGASSSTTSSPC